MESNEIRWIDWVFLGGEIIAALWALGALISWLKQQPRVRITYYCNTNSLEGEDEELTKISITVRHLSGKQLVFEQTGIFMRVGGRIFKTLIPVIKVSEENQIEEVEYDVPLFEFNRPLLRRHVLGVELKSIKGKCYYSSDVPKNYRQSRYKQMRWKFKMFRNRLNGID